MATALVVLAWYLTSAIAVTVGYHRVLAHRSARLPPWLLRTLVVLGLPAGPPAAWAGNHRRHHADADTEADPHSPRHGLLHAHCGWYLGLRSPVASFAYALAGPFRLPIDVALRPCHPCRDSLAAPDVLRDPLLRWLSTRVGFAAGAALHLMAALAVAADRGSWGYVLVHGMAVVLYNVGDAVNSLGHGPATRSGETCEARDHAVLAALTFGDGWHGTHHARPDSARHAPAGSVDPAYVVIAALERLGLATDVRHDPGASS